MYFTEITRLVGTIEDALESEYLEIDRVEPPRKT